MMQTNRNVVLPADLCQRAETKFIGPHFATLEDLIVFLLQELMRDDVVAIDAAEEKIVEERLRDLGYI